MAHLHHVVEGTGRHVVLLHAGVADLRMWHAQVEALVPGHAVVRCDLAGFGGTPPHTRPGECHAEDVLLLLDECGVERFALVGASFGGYIALQIATAVPDRVDALVLLAAAADLVEPDDSLRAVWRREEELLENGDVDAATELMVDSWIGPEADDDARALLRTMQRRAYDLQPASGEEGEERDLEVDLARVAAPATVVVGAHDFPFFRATARALVEGLPDARLAELAWARHLPSLERPAETARLVAAALGRRAPLTRPVDAPR